MKRVRRLSELEVRRADPGWHNDGGGLYLRVDKTGGAYWFFRWGAQGRCYFSLGPRHTLTLRSARDKAQEYQAVVRDHRDPRAERKAKRKAAKVAAANDVTLTQVIDRYFAAHKDEWGATHARDWRSRLKRYIEPVLGDYPAAEIDTNLVVQALTPIWTPDTIELGKRIQRSLERILDYAKTSGLRAGDNPARWKAHLADLLASPTKVSSVEHYAAMPYADIPAFLQELQQRSGVDARCLEFLILTGVRRDEARGAFWSEIRGNTWLIPAARMKMERDHRVPLSKQAEAVLDQMGPESNGLIFPGRRDGSGRLGNSVLNDLLKEMRPGSGYTVHGFRSAFRDWMADQTDFSRQVCEKALAHKVGSDIEEAYLRSDLLEKRRQLMEAWGRYCRPALSIVPTQQERRVG
jgi:integrase